MHWLTEPSTSITEEKKVSVAACQDLRDIPGVRNCGSHIGQALLSDEVYGAYFGENWISVSDKVDYDDTLQKVTDTVDSYPGMQRDVQTYLRERVKEVLTGSSGAVVVRIFGPDPRKLTELADTTLKAIGDTPGLIEAAAALQKEVPQIEIELDLAKARKLRPQAGRHPAPVVGVHRQRGGLRHLLRRPRLRRPDLVDPERAPQLPGHQGPADRHPGGRQGEAVRRRGRSVRAEPERDPARRPVTPHRRRGQHRRGRRPRCRRRGGGAPRRRPSTSRRSTASRCSASRRSSRTPRTRWPSTASRR